MHRGIWRASVCVHVRRPCRNELFLWLSSELSSTSRKLFLRAAAPTYVCLHITSCYGNTGKSLETVHCVCQVWFYVDFFLLLFIYNWYKDEVSLWSGGVSGWSEVFRNIHNPSWFVYVLRPVHWLLQLFILMQSRRAECCRSFFFFFLMRNTVHWTWTWFKRLDRTESSVERVFSLKHLNLLSDHRHCLWLFQIMSPRPGRHGC